MVYIRIRLKVDYKRTPLIIVMVVESSLSVWMDVSSASMYAMEKRTAMVERMKKTVFNMSICLRRKLDSRFTLLYFLQTCYPSPTFAYYNSFVMIQIQNAIPEGYKKDLTFTKVESAEACAKMCMQTKRCSCTSFSYNTQRKKCILTDR